MKRQLIFTKKDSDEILPLPDEDLKNLITTKYDFDVGYHPEGYDVCFLLLKEDADDSRKDLWKIVFFNKSSSVGNVGTLTLDNVDQVDEFTPAITKYEILKEIDGNFEQIIDSAVGLIKKLKKS